MKILGFLYEVMKRFLIFTVVMIAYMYEYIKNHRIVYSKWVNCMVHELYLNKTKFLFLFIFILNSFLKE